MVTIQRLLCPVDFSDFSRHALDHAAAIARWYTPRIRVVHVLPTIQAAVPAGDAGLFPAFVFTQDDLEHVREEVATFARESLGDRAFDVEVVQGHPAGEIARLARTWPADLVVMGTHGRTGFERLLLGSTTERVLMTVPAPVLTVPRRTPDAAPLGPVLFTNLLCAIDFSPASRAALHYARALTAEAGARLHAVTVIERPPVSEPVMMGGPGTPDGELAAQRLARARLREWMTEAGVPPDEVHLSVASGKAYREILRLAAEQHADLIVMGAHSGATGHPAFGSTTAHVVRGAAAPVLTLKP